MCWWVSPEGEAFLVQLHGHAAWASDRAGLPCEWESARKLMSEGWLQLSGDAIRAMVEPIRGAALRTCQKLLAGQDEVFVCMVVPGNVYGERRFDRDAFCKRRVIRLRDMES